MIEHIVYVKGQILPLIEDGSKPLEIRPALPRFRQIKQGEVIFFNGRVRRRVVDVKFYPHVTKAITEENADRLWPGHTRQEVLNKVRGFYSRWNREFMIFELAPT